MLLTDLVHEEHVDPNERLGGQAHFLAPPILTASLQLLVVEERGDLREREHPLVGERARRVFFGEQLGKQLRGMLPATQKSISHAVGAHLIETREAQQLSQFLENLKKIFDGNRFEFMERRLRKAERRQSTA